MARISTWNCDICTDEKQEGEAHRVRFLGKGDQRQLQLCRLDDDRASDRVVCLECQKQIVANNTEPKPPVGG